MADWNAAIAALEETGRELQTDPTEFQELPVTLGILQALFEKKNEHPYLAILLFLIHFLEKVQTEFSVDNWMDTEALLIERAVALRRIGKRLVAFAQFCRYEASNDAFLHRLSQLAEDYQMATAWMNGQAAEEAAASFRSGRVLDANP